MNFDKTPHIMNASTNLVGFSFIVLTSLKAFYVGHIWFIDETTVLAVTGFILSTLLSFLSMRSKNEKLAERYEIIADYVFFASLLIMLIVCILLTVYD